MRAAEKALVTDLIAAWEWNRDISTTGARARYDCSKELAEALAITDADLVVARAMRLAELAGYGYSAEIEGFPDEFDIVTDYLTDIIEDRGYEVLCSLVEELGFQGLANKALSSNAPAADL